MRYGFFIVSVLLFAVLLTGCIKKNNFLSDHSTELDICEDLVSETEFSEYPPNTEEIVLIITNNLDSDFIYGQDNIVLQKKESGQWRDVRNNATSSWGILLALESNKSAKHTVYLKRYFSLPLPTGEYRLGITSSNGKIVTYGDFTVK